MTKAGYRLAIADEVAVAQLALMSGAQLINLPIRQTKSVVSLFSHVETDKISLDNSNRLGDYVCITFFILYIMCACV